MIDPISAFGMLTTAHQGIKKIISMSQDFSKASKYVMDYAKAEAELSFGKERKKKGLFGGIMDQAIEQHFKEEEQKRMKDELRSLFQLYGSYGQWERLQQTIAEARKQHRDYLKKKAEIRDRNILIVSVSTVIIVGVLLIIWMVKYLKG